jgi:hypothetical protein
MPLSDPGLYLLLALWGGVAAVDGTSWGQFMISRPLVAATVAGWIAGSPAAGAAVGVVLEAFHLTVLPVGAARYPEGGPPAAVAGAMFAMSDRLPSTLLAVLLFFLAWEWVGGETIRLMRQVNVRLLAPISGRPVAPGAVERRHLAAIGIDFTRGAGLVLLGLPLLGLLLRWLPGAWSLGERGAQVAVAAVLAGLIASSLRMFGRRARLFVVGAAAGLLLLLVRG